MADQIISGDSKEAVAYALLVGIAHNEGKTAFLQGITAIKADETWVLQTYKKCLRAVENYNVD